MSLHHDFERSLRDYFREQLTDIGSRMQPTPQEDTFWYLGNMLARFGRSDNVFNYENGQVSLRPLALLYGDAMKAESHRERCLLLRQLGDMSLFLGALFPEVFIRKGIRKDYLIGMGGGAYDYLADNADRHRHVFSELSRAFANILRLVSEACSKQNHFDAQDILALYHRWQRTSDPIAARQLAAIGITLGDEPTLQ